MKPIEILASVILSLTVTVQADTIYVCWDGSGDYLTIQEGIDAAYLGDEVVVCDGVYTGDGNRDLDFGGKAITVRSANGPENCTIDCEGSDSDPHRGFYFHSGETTEAVVDGFTIRNGYQMNGGAVYCTSSSPTITGCAIVGNMASDCGGGVYCYRSNLALANCRIVANRALGWDWVAGGGVYCDSGSPTISNSLIIRNTTAVGGSAVGCMGADNPTVTNCTIAANVALQGGCIFFSGDTLTMTNCIVWDNVPNDVGGNPSYVAITYSDFQGGWSGEGNIDADPRFAFASDYHIMPDSPCIDAGTNDPPGGLPPDDLDGNQRSLDGDDDGAPVADMGAYEFNPGAPSIAVSPAALEFFAYEGGVNPDDQILSIRNCGGGILSWQVAEGCSWLEGKPLAGQSGGEIDEAVLSVDVGDLSHGDHCCRMTVSDPAAVNTPRTVVVTLHVSTTLTVPDQHATIQAAIDAAVDGDVVVVADGTYAGPGNRDLDFHARAITVHSANGPDNCVIDCEGGQADPHRGFFFYSGETTAAVVDGFTVRNGYARWEGACGTIGGGILCMLSNPTIANCTITGNTAPYE